MGAAFGLQTIEAPPARQVKVTTDKKMSVVLLDDPSMLEDHKEAWDELTMRAAEPNPFYESWMLLPALRRLGSENVRVALVYARNSARPDGMPLLCGLFPLEFSPRYKGLPVEVLRLWQHTYCSLSTPLLRYDCARETLMAFFDWIERAGAPLIEFQCAGADGPFHHALIDVINQRASLSFVSDAHTRAMFRPRSDFDSYLRAAASREHRKDMRRKEKRLSDMGRIRYSSLECDEELHEWIEEFLELESAGWKGRNRSALACEDASREYFIEIVSEAYRRGKLDMLALRLDGRPIAMKCNFLAGSGSFAFKIAFDEDFARSSPGVLLELENLRRLHRESEVQWMDSCARATHPMVNRLWLDRRAIQTTLISSGSATGDLIVSLMPLVRWLHRRLRKPLREIRETEVNEL